MPIVQFSHNFNSVPEGAVNLKGTWERPHYVSDEEYERRKADGSASWYFGSIGPSILWTWHTHTGLCLKEWENNGYNDSDFWMRVWDPVKAEPEDIMFATTRGWSYPSLGSRVDATDEVKAAYDAWMAVRQVELAEQRRKLQIREKWERRAAKRELARAIGEANYTRLRKLEAVVPGGHWAQTVKLLTAKKLRSTFRISLRDQILKWYHDPSPVYSTPLSRKQWDYV